MPNWRKVHEIMPRKYVCGYCGNTVMSNRGYWDDQLQQGIWICPCGNPTFFDSKNQYPSYPFGNKIEGIAEAGVRELYDEARRCTAAQAFTAAVLVCRKLLMHIAVEKGAPEGKSFIEYVEFLSDNHYVPPDGKGWVDYIRKKGNEATHEIVLMKQEDATDLISFTEMLLRFVYEFPSKIKPSGEETQA